MNLLVAGRFFYEIDLQETSLDSIEFIHFHGALDYMTEFNIRSGRFPGFLIIIILLICLSISLIVYYKCCRKPKEVGIINQIEMNDKLIKQN